jgi:ABC-type glutathione transport system ATPase component
MDPITRRYVWDIILEAKQGRAIVLTTHSMEEADVLADTITIIAKGRLRCFGSALRLKGKFGAGYRIAASVNSGMAGSNADLARLGRSTSSDELAGRSQRMVDFFRANLGVEPSEIGRVYTTFVVPRAMEANLAGFLRTLQENKAALGITDMQMSLTTLEQVFLLIAREAEKQAAAADGRTVALELPLEGGRVVRIDVPWGIEKGVFSETGEEVEVHWLQDDEGRLQYAHHMWRGEKITQHMSDDKKSCCCCC